MLLTSKTFLVAALRGLSLFAKLVFTILLARLLSVEEFGQWVLVVAIVTYGTFIVGAEVYNLTLRTYIAEGYAAVVPKFSIQWTSFAIAYIIILLGGAALSYVGGGPLNSNALIIAAILVLEHLTLEIYRIATFRDHQVHANTILLIKTAGWMIPVGVYLFLARVNIGFGVVLCAWLIGCLISAVYALAIYREVFRGLKPAYIRDLSGKIGRAFGLLAPFLTLSVAARTPLILDRYFIEHFAGPAQVGAYGYYATFGNGVQALFDAVILARLIPRLLSDTQGREARTKTVLSFMRMAIAFWLVWGGILYVLIPYINGFVGKESFQNAFGLLLVLFLGQMVFSLAAIVQYGLYAMHRDRQLTTGALLYLALCLTFYVALIPKLGSYGAAAALAIAAAGLLIMRMYQLLYGHARISGRTRDAGA
jgi:O-antigen/teichoic acid export membrane protein